MKAQIVAWCGHFPSKLPYCPCITSWCSHFPSKLPYCPHITSWCSRPSLYILLRMAISCVFASCHMLGHTCDMMSLIVIHHCCHCISEYVQGLLLIFCWHTSQACFNVYHLVACSVFRKHSPKNVFFIRTIVDLIDNLCDCFLCRFFSCTGSSKKCNVFTLLLRFSQITKEL